MSSVSHGMRPSVELTIHTFDPAFGIGKLLFEIVHLLLTLSFALTEQQQLVDALYSYMEQEGGGVTIGNTMEKKSWRSHLFQDTHCVWRAGLAGTGDGAASRTGVFPCHGTFWRTCASCRAHRARSRPSRALPPPHPSTTLTQAQSAPSHDAAVSPAQDHIVNYRASSRSVSAVPRLCCCSLSRHWQW